MTSEITIEFPCRYPIKVIGDMQAGGAAEILRVVREHAPEVTPDDVSTRESRNGNYHSVRITILATGEAQLKQLHSDLLALPAVRMVL